MASAGRQLAAVPTRIRHWVAATAADLPEAQRWTVGLLLALSVALVAFGLPKARDTTATGSFDAAPAGATVQTHGGTDAAGVGSTDDAAAPVLAANDMEVAADSGVPAAGAVGPVGGAAPVEVVAVVRDADGDFPGRDDAFAAAVFLPDVGVRTAVVRVAEARDRLCSATPPGQRVVLSSSALPRELRSCLASSGTIVLAFDEAGSSGRSFSTRLGAATAMVDAAVAGKATDRVGLAVSDSRAEAAGEAKRVLGHLGFRVEVAAVPAGDSSAMVAGMQAFDAADVSTVVFAMPVNDQARWVALEQLLRRQPKHVVADVADAFVGEQYPVTFDGAVGVATSRVAWFARDHGETAVQAGCRSRYEKAAAPAVGVSPAELARAFMWCEHASIVRAALAGGGRVDEALAQLSIDSPLTSALGRGPDGVFGPRQEALLRWQRGCGCWVEQRGFEDRVVHR